MALDPKLIIGAAVLGFFFLGDKKSTKSNAADKKDEKDNTGKGDLNEPVGPNGCKEGLKNIKGTCVDDPDLDENGNPIKGGSGSGSKLAPSDLFISKKCDYFTFGDKTGNAWWKAKGEKIATQYVKAEETDPLLIAFQMLKKTGSCFKEFPIRKEFENWFEYNTAKFWWIEKNSEMWTLLYTVRNIIDINLFDGVETVIADPKKADYALKFGNAFNMDTLWKSIEPMAYTLLQLEANKPGSVLNIKDGYDNPIYIISNVATYLYSLILPNIPYTEIVTKVKKGWFTKQTPLWNELWKLVNSIEGQSPDLESEQF